MFDVSTKAKIMPEIRNIDFHILHNNRERPYGKNVASKCHKFLFCDI